MLSLWRHVQEQGNGAEVHKDPAPLQDKERSKRKGKGGQATEKEERRKQAKAERQRKAQLELLMMDDAALQDTAKLGTPANTIKALSRNCSLLCGADMLQGIHPSLGKATAITRF